FQYQLVKFEDDTGYINLKIEKADARKKPISTFTNLNQAKNFMFKITGEFGLCQKLTGLHTGSGACFAHSIRECNGACIENENANEYNNRVRDFLTKYSFKDKTLLLIDKGRDVDERSVVFIEQGRFKGVAFISLNYQITNTDVL